MAYQIYITSAFASIYQREFNRPTFRSPKGDVIMASIDDLEYQETTGSLTGITVGDKTLVVNSNHIIALKPDEKEKAKVSLV